MPGDRGGEGPDCPGPRADGGGDEIPPPARPILRPAGPPPDMPDPAAGAGPPIGEPGGGGGGGMTPPVPPSEPNGRPHSGCGQTVAPSATSPPHHRQRFILAPSHATRSAARLQSSRRRPSVSTAPKFSISRNLPVSPRSVAYFALCSGLENTRSETLSVRSLSARSSAVRPEPLGSW